MSITTLDLRGRDLIILPPEHEQHLSLSELLTMLFATYLPATILSSFALG